MQTGLNKNFAAELARVAVVPVLTIDDADKAIALGRALVAGGLPILEVTLRTPAALTALAAMARNIPDAIVGAGTVLSSDQARQATEHGAQFLVSPGSTPDLLKAMENCPVPTLPGVATASEAMTLAERGYGIVKFFPAEPAGGVGYLKALSQPLPHIRFCPTGGIGQGNAASYLACPNVVCVGGSWVAPADAVEAGRWNDITELARQAAALKPPAR
jgi:2-dehydro-3-deoxyphosphogluconate aldolase/(4S)-4-hydroxy-2-oxoglutarate aldolase